MKTCKEFTSTSFEVIWSHEFTCSEWVNLILLQEEKRMRGPGKQSAKTRTGSHKIPGWWNDIREEWENSLQCGSAVAKHVFFTGTGQEEPWRTLQVGSEKPAMFHRVGRLWYSDTMWKDWKRGLRGCSWDKLSLKERGSQLIFFKVA